MFKRLLQDLFKRVFDTVLNLHKLCVQEMFRLESLEDGPVNSLRGGIFEIINFVWIFLPSRNSPFIETMLTRLIYPKVDCTSLIP